MNERHVIDNDFLAIEAALLCNFQTTCQFIKESISGSIDYTFVYDEEEDRIRCVCIKSKENNPLNIKYSLSIAELIKILEYDSEYKLNRVFICKKSMSPRGDCQISDNELENFTIMREKLKNRKKSSVKAELRVEDAFFLRKKISTVPRNNWSEQSRRNYLRLLSEFSKM